jgi:transposase
VFKLKGVRATVLLEAWLAWARRCRIPAFVRLARTITEHQASIQATLTQGCPTDWLNRSTPRSAC